MQWWRYSLILVEIQGNLIDGLVIIAHVDKRTEKRADDSEVEILGPAIPKRAYEIVNQLVDIIGYIDVTWDEEGNSERWIYTRKTPTVMAGSRFKYLAPKIRFGYNELVSAISEAIDKEAAAAGNEFITNEPMSKQHLNEPTYNFEALMGEFQDLVGSLMSSNPSMSSKITAIIDKHLGKGKKVGDCTPEQAPQIDLILFDLKRL